MKRVKVPAFHKAKMRALLELIAGGERELTVAQLNKWRDLILYAVSSMRSEYENRRVAKNYDARVYYQPCWKRIEEAKDDVAMVEALESLRGSIQFE